MFFIIFSVPVKNKNIVPFVQQIQRDELLLELTGGGYAILLAVHLLVLGVGGHRQR
jgi:hypothetical protein